MFRNVFALFFTCVMLGKIICRAASCILLSNILSMKVSAHLLIQRSGDLVQFVDFGKRAWHAGQSTYEGRSDCNDFSVGIELEGTDDDPYTDAQYTALLAVTNVLIAQYPAMDADKIVGHCDIAPGRKTDPGPAFDWHRYRQQLEEAGRL